MKMYYANNRNLKIEEREVVRQTTSSVFIEVLCTGRRQNEGRQRARIGGAWFDTHEEAKNYFIKQMDSDIIRYTMLLRAANEKMLKVRSI